jgi:hypothetical protein
VAYKCPLCGVKVYCLLDDPYRDWPLASHLLFTHGRPGPRCWCGLHVYGPIAMADHLYDHGGPQAHLLEFGLGLFDES